MGQDSPKKKLKREHNKQGHTKSKPSSEAKPKKKASPSKPKKSEQPPKSEEKLKKEKPAKEKPKEKPVKPKKPEKSEKSEDHADVLMKPGQKHPEPSLDDPTRAFYESLYEQNPGSVMAQKYCLEHGLLPEDTCLKLVEALKKKQKS